MKRILIGITFWFAFIFATVASYMTVVAVHLFCKVGGISPNRTVEHRYVRLWPRMIWLFNFWWLRIHIDGKENLPPDGKAVVMVANHESMFDIFVMYFIDTQFRWLSKKEVLRIPCVGGGMKVAGYVTVDRGNPRSHHEAMVKSADWLRRGIPMFFFPEGTRSTTSELRPFKAGAFRLAIDGNIPILPIVILGTGRILPRGAMVPRPATIHMRILPEMNHRLNETYDDYAARVREVIVKERDVMQKHPIAPI